MSINRIETEKRVVETMIRAYCKGKHGNSHLCDDCRALLGYSVSRLSSCRYGEDKPFCSKCPVHCYTPQKRDAIKQVMHYSGPRMLLIDPIMAIRHLLSIRKRPGSPGR